MPATAATARPERPPSRCTPVLALLALLAAGCQDLREYAGGWSGEISSDPALAQGLSPATVLTLEISAVSRDAIAFSAAWQGRSATFVPIRRAAADVLSDAQLPGDPLRTFFGYLQPAGEAPYLAVLSLFPENRIELRLIRGPDEIYGVFALHRTISPVQPAVRVP